MIGKQRSVVLFSGGLDSTVALYYARQVSDVFALTFRYGQSNQFEVDAAIEIAKLAGVKSHIVSNLDLRLFRDCRHDHTSKQLAPGYVPNRNAVFLSMAVAMAEAAEAVTVYIGTNADDHVDYPDTRPEFIEAFNRVSKMGIKSQYQIEIIAPFSRLTKAEVIQKGLELGVPLSLTQTCYNPLDNGNPCGICLACGIKQNAFKGI